MTRKLPDDAAAWLAQWRSAAPLLQEIRDQELRQLTTSDVVDGAEVVLTTPTQDADDMSPSQASSSSKLGLCGFGSFNPWGNSDDGPRAPAHDPD